MATTNDATFFADSKLRRETSNFKINFTEGTYIPDPNSENPTEPIQGLLQILPKNLGPEDFIGLVLQVPADDDMPSIFTAIREVRQTEHGWEIYDGIFYHPSTGYLVDDQYPVAVKEGSGGSDDHGNPFV